MDPAPEALIQKAAALPLGQRGKLTAAPHTPGFPQKMPDTAAAAENLRLQPFAFCQFIQGPAVDPRDPGHVSSPIFSINASTRCRWSSAWISRSTTLEAISMAIPGKFHSSPRSAPSSAPGQSPLPRARAWLPHPLRPPPAVPVHASGRGDAASCRSVSRSAFA